PQVAGVLLGRRVVPGEQAGEKREHDEGGEQDRAGGGFGRAGERPPEPAPHPNAPDRRSADSTRSLPRHGPAGPGTTTVMTPTLVLTGCPWCAGRRSRSRCRRAGSPPAPPP